jgi:hypothetical protein
MIIDLVAWALTLAIWFLAFIAGIIWVVDTLITWREDAGRGHR